MSGWPVCSVGGADANDTPPLDVLPANAIATSSRLSRYLAGRRTGLKDRLPSGVVGAVELSKKPLSSESTMEGDPRSILGVGWPAFGEAGQVKVRKKRAPAES